MNPNQCCSSKLMSRAGERVVITNQPRRTGECSGLELGDHEHIRRHIVLASEAVPLRGNETKTRIVFGVADDNYRAKAEILATHQTLAHQRRANALALEIRHNSHWRKPHQIEVVVRGQRYWRKENVSDN